MTDSLDIALAQLNLTVGDIAGNAAKIRAARAERGGSGRASRGHHRTRPLRLSARGSGAQAGFPRRGRSARARHWRPRPRTAARRSCSARPGGTTARFTMPPPCWPMADDQDDRLQARSAELRRVRREARLPRRPAARADRVSRAEARRDDLRGHVDAGRARSTSRSKGAEVLLVPNGSPFEMDKEGTRLALARDRVTRDRPAAALRQSGRRSGRTGLRRRLLRARR